MTLLVFLDVAIKPYTSRTHPDRLEENNAEARPSASFIELGARIGRTRSDEMLNLGRVDEDKGMEDAVTASNSSIRADGISM